jgi:hypothetical protein
MQKSISQIITTVCRELSLPAPATIVSNQDANVQQLLAFASSVKDDLLNEHDWQVLETEHIFTTVDGQTDYPFPLDIKYFISGTFFDQTNRWELRGPMTPRQWTWVQVWEVAGQPFMRYTIQQGKIKLFPVPQETEYKFRFMYMSDAAVLDGSSMLPKAEFTQDSDIFRLDARTMIYGIKLKYLSAKGQPTGDALADYNRALNAAKGQDAPSQRISLLRPTSPFMLSLANIPDGNWGV